MGYGKRALKLLRNYYEGKFTSLKENDEEYDEEDNGIEKLDDEDVDLLKETIAPRKKVPTLLKRLSERRPEHLDYLGTSYGLTGELLKFWKSQKFVPVYLSQKTNDLTGEHSCIMISKISQENTESTDWLSMYFHDFRRRILKLLGKSFNSFTTGLSLSLLDNRAVTLKEDKLSQNLLDTYFLPHDVQRLEAYTRNQVEYKLILDLTYDLGILIFENKMKGVQIDALQKAIILGIGLQNKNLDGLSEEFNMPVNQILAKFYDSIKKITSTIVSVMEQNIEKTMTKESDLDTGKSLIPMAKSFNEELDEAARGLEKKQKKELNRLKQENLAQFAIKGTEEEWGKVLVSNKSSIISIKSGEKRIGESTEIVGLEEPGAKKKKKGGGKKFGGKQRN